MNYLNRGFSKSLKIMKEITIINQGDKEDSKSMYELGMCWSVYLSFQ